MNPELDHLILGCRDLGEGIAYVERLSGYRAALGGSHPGRGTQNALLRLGRTSYLEILAPDPEQQDLKWQKKIVELSEPRLVGWALKASKLDRLAASFRARGIPVMGPAAGSRTTPEGDVLRWRTVTLVDDREGTLPFYIEWDPALGHPARNAPGACHLLEFQSAGEFEPRRKQEPRGNIITSPQTHNARVELRATIRGKAGEFVLYGRSLLREFPAPLNSLRF